MTIRSEIKDLIKIAKEEPRRILENEDDLWYRFAETFLTITDVDGNVIPFVPKAEQRRFLELYFEAKRNGEQFRAICLKARQIGFSTLLAMLFLVESCVQANSEVLIAAQLKDGPAQNIFDKYVDAIRNMPQNKKKPDRAIFAPGGSPGSGRIRLKNSKSLIRLIGERIEVGATLTGVHVSECAHYNNFAEFMTHLRPAIRTGQNKSIILESTAKTHGDAFHDEYNAAVQGRGGWQAFFSPWHKDEMYQTEIPESQRESFQASLSRHTQLYGDELQLQRDYALTLEQLWWRRETIDEAKSLATFSMNYPSNAEEAFLSADRPVFHVPSLNWHRERAIEAPQKGDYQTLVEGRRPVGDDKFEFVESHLGTIERWEGPQDDAEYVWAADVAEGIPSGDFCVALVAKRSPFEVVAKIRGDDTTKLETLDFSRQLCYLLRDYGEPKGLPEINNHGHTVVNLLTEWGLSKCMMYESEIHETAQIKRQGYLTTHKSKIELFDVLTDVMRVDFDKNRPTGEFSPIVPDLDTIMELYQIITDGKKIHARRKGEVRPHGDNSVGYHDDLAIALGLLVLAQKALPAPKRPEEILVRKFGHGHPMTHNLDWVDVHDPIASSREYVR